MKLKIFFYAVLLLILAGLTAVIFQNVTKQQDENRKLDANSEQKVLKEAVNGTLVSPEIARKRPMAVVIENHPDSRPQSGLGDADIVYETLAEGGITRFLALFQTGRVKNIGPVRSAREYFAELADEWRAVFAHVGGSNETIAKLKDGVYRYVSDANEYYNEQFFERIAERPAPHNVYTSIEQLEKLAAFRKFETTASFFPYLFKDDEPSSNLAALATNTPLGMIGSKIHIDFSRTGYEVDYQYDPVGNDYLRFLAGKPHLDADTKAQLKAKNVVVQLVEVIPVPKDPLLKVDIKLLGQGRAVTFQDGKVRDGSWIKSVDQPTRYFDEQGGEIKFNRGPIWIELVPTEKSNNLIWR